MSSVTTPAAVTAAPAGGSGAGTRSGGGRLGRAWMESILVLAAVGLLWWLATHYEWVSRVFLPSPAATLASLLHGLGLAGEGGGGLAGFTWSTVQRMLLGWLLASATGVALGALIGVSNRAREWLQPTLEFIRPLPASAVLPLAIAIFGLSAKMVLIVVAFGSMWPVLLATIHGFASVDPRLDEVAQALEMGRWERVWKIDLPNSMPDILAGMRLSMTVSLIIAVVGEMIASQSGLGQAVLLAARSFRASELFAGVVLLGAIGFAANALLTLAEKRLLRWQRP